MDASLNALVSLPSLLAVCLLFVLPTAGHADAPLPPLPEGNTGLAAKYPGDVGIENDPAVVLHADFEDCSTTADLHSTWDNIVHVGNMRIVEGAPNVHSGRKALEIAIPKQDQALSVNVEKILTAPHTRDVLFLRYYLKFDPGFDIPRNSCHDGGSISAGYWSGPSAGPGKRADGRNKFLTSFETEIGSPGNPPSPGPLNVYIYYPEQRGDYGDHFYPSGIVMPNTSLPGDFGPHFVPRLDFVPERGRWYCFEYMLKANTPGQRDGRVACWVDGKLIADFPNLRFRDIDSLKIDRFGVGLYIAKNTIRENKEWYDDVVAATSYIGPRIVGERR